MTPVSAAGTPWLINSMSFLISPLPNFFWGIRAMGFAMPTTTEAVVIWEVMSVIVALIPELAIMPEPVQRRVDSTMAAKASPTIMSATVGR